MTNKEIRDLLCPQMTAAQILWCWPDSSDFASHILSLWDNHPGLKIVGKTANECASIITCYAAMEIATAIEEAFYLQSDETPHDQVYYWVLGHQFAYTDEISDVLAAYVEHAKVM